VAFAPASAGAKTGTLTVASSAMAQNMQAPLSGTGFDFTVAATGQTSQTVASGLTANYTLSITPLNGSSGTFTFACGSLPANVVCVFNPTSEQVAANTTGSETVEVETGQAVQAASAKGGAGWGGMELGMGLLLLPLAWRRKRKAWLLVLLLVVLAGGLSSCAGAGGGYLGQTSGAGGTNTPAGTYSISVTATAYGVSHPVTLSLTVD
jgi:hypothetical protein